MSNTLCQQICRFKILKIYFHLPGHDIHLSHLFAHLFATRNRVLYFTQANILQLFLLGLKKGIRRRLSIFFGTFAGMTCTTSDFNLFVSALKR